MLGRLAVFVWIGLAAPATAQTWQAATGPTAKLGLQALACKGEFCLAIACRGGKAELVSMSPGGGPFNGATAVTVGTSRATVQFVEDPKIMDAFNMLGTRGAVPASLIGQIATASDITLSGPTFSDKMTAKFTLHGYAKLAPAIAKACGVTAGGTGTLE